MNSIFLKDFQLIFYFGNNFINYIYQQYSRACDAARKIWISGRKIMKRVLQYPEIFACRATVEIDDYLTLYIQYPPLFRYSYLALIMGRLPPAIGRHPLRDDHPYYRTTSPPHYTTATPPPLCDHYLSTTRVVLLQKNDNLSLSAAGENFWNASAM